MVSSTWSITFNHVMDVMPSLRAMAALDAVTPVNVHYPKHPVLTVHGSRR
ncbi:MAG: hypothetical protein P1U77_26415 [Rubripirellula sp.]|nr:hypothetical protein [Rubripirellula sp.]